MAWARPTSTASPGTPSSPPPRRRARPASTAPARTCWWTRRRATSAAPGPAVAEIEFERDPAARIGRPSRSCCSLATSAARVRTTIPLYAVFCDPMHNGGLLLSARRSTRASRSPSSTWTTRAPAATTSSACDVPERVWDVACLLQNPDRFAIEAIHSRHKPDEQMVSVSATRLHNIAGTYTGKDDPVAIVRTQGIFPAPEEVVEPYTLGHFVTGDCRGSHVMPIMPVADQHRGRRPVLPAASSPASPSRWTRAGRFTDGVARRLRQRRLGRDAAQGPAEGRRVAAAGLHRPDHGLARRARLHGHRGHAGRARPGIRRTQGNLTEGGLG